MTALLSPRETEILQLAAEGNLDKEIAWQLNIALQTVKNHFFSIKNKLGAKDRTHAVTLALKLGLITLDKVEPWSGRNVE